MIRHRYVTRLIVLLTSLYLPLAGCEPGQESDSYELPIVGSVRFAVIGDYGSAGTAEAAVATLVASWGPDLVITVGDNNYTEGAAATIDQNIGQYYHDFIYPYTGSYGAGATYNKFFPALGNHDWNTPGAQPYLDYFQLPGNERYYDFVAGPVHFFAIDSDSDEPDGTSASSAQASWLQGALAASTAPWKIVYLHHPPYSSGSHGSSTTLRWPFKEWGASAVLAGHDHTYERLLVDDLTYFVNGLGGRSLYSFGTVLSESVVRYNGDYGAMRADASESAITFEFINRSGEIIDTYTMEATAPPPPPPPSSVIRSYRDGVAPSTSYAGTRDTYISQNSSTTNYGAALTVNMDGQDPAKTAKDVSALLSWDISDIPPGSQVTAASITLNVVNSSGGQAYEVYRLLRGWDELSCTWNRLASGTNWTGAGATGVTDRDPTVLGSLGTSSTGMHTITLNASGVAMVQEWVDNPTSNAGVIIMDAVNTNGLDVSSSEVSTAALRPMLTVSYDIAQ